MNVRLLIAYDGTAYLGWQKTKMGPSIEEALETALKRLLQEEITLQAASRTDAGVHAKGQVVNFFTKKEEIDCQHLKRCLSHMLPRDIAVWDASIAADSFHPTLDATKKRYSYTICLGPVQLPHHRTTSWHIYKPVDLSAMQKAAHALIGEKDFTSLCNRRKNLHYDTYTRRVDRIEIIEFEKNRLRIEVEGSNFLYKMVRNIVGTLVSIGLGKLHLKTDDILEAHDRRLGGVTAPAHGLMLEEVYYTSRNSTD